MIKCTVLKNGDLKVTADNETRKVIKENKDYNYWCMMRDLFESYWINGEFTHFDPSNANPFVGLTSAPCIAESMYPDDCKNVIDGRLWAFKDYVMRDDLDELKNKGFVIYQLVEEDNS